MFENNEEKNKQKKNACLVIYNIFHMHTACATAKGHKMPLLNYINEYVSEFVLKTLRWIW